LRHERLLFLLKDSCLFTLLQVVEKRKIYLSKLKQYRALPLHDQYREVYLDESYIHKNHNRLNLSIRDPTDDLPEPRRPKKSERFCFITAMQGQDPCARTASGSQAPEHLPGLVAHSLEIFKGGNRSDYHKTFNAQVFEKWFAEQLLPNLKQKSLITMDNASYHRARHRAFGEVRNAPKEELERACDTMKIPRSEYVSTMRNALFKELQRIHPLPTIVTMARAAGHEILYTPPYHCDLQPIEMLWARVKREVANQYSTTTTMDNVKERLIESFLRVSKDHEFIGSLIGNTKKKENRYYAIELELEKKNLAEDQADLDEGNDDSEADDCDDESESEGKGKKTTSKR
jgi:transposase